jgi:hypothetical protein
VSPFVRRARGIGAILAASAALAPAASADTAPPPPAELQVLDGDGWHDRNRFDLRWTNAATGPDVAAVHYLVRDPLGGIVVGPVELAGPRREIDGIRVPSSPGAYTAEVWLESTGGSEGPAATARLRFDPTPPAQVAALAPSGWLSRNELPYAIRIGHPAGPQPVSGIRGYAISIDRSASSSPCAGSERCSDAETDLRGGVDEDALIVDELPEGVSYVHALAVSGSQVHSVAAGHTPLRVDRTDPITRLSGDPAGWTNRTVKLEAVATDSGSGMTAGGDGAPFTAIRVDDGAPVVDDGGSVSAAVIAPGIHNVVFYARDAAGNVDDGADVNGGENAEPSATTVRIDRRPPTVVFAGSPDPEDPELIEARVSDALSGPDPSRGQIAVRAAGSDGAYEPLPTVVAGGKLFAHWASDDYPVGEYEFRATGYDAAGNAATSASRANEMPMVLPNPLKARAILSAGFGTDPGTPRTAQAVPYGQGATFSGSLRATSDIPLAGKPVTVIERFDRGAAGQRRETVVSTGADGSFSLQLEPGANREVFAVFAGTRTATGTSSRPLRLQVAGGVRLRASARLARIGGRPIVFRGSVACDAGELPADGATVQLQFRAAGLPWSEFRTVQTNGRGGFRYAYRFSDDDSRGVSFRFRAVVPTQSDWPYEPGGSRPVAVRGT